MECKSKSLRSNREQQWASGFQQVEQKESDYSPEWTLLVESLKKRQIETEGSDFG